MITVRDIKFFNVAKALSLLSDFNNYKIGAVVVLKNEIIATGYNRNCTHPLQAYWSKLVGIPFKTIIHAEMDCLVKLRNTKYNLNKAKIYVYKQNRGGGLSISKPCIICSTALKANGITNVYHTVSGGYVKMKL